MEGYAQLFARKRILVVAFVCAMSALALYGLGRLEFDDVPRGIFVSDDAESARLERVYEQFGSDDNEVLLVLEADDWLAQESTALLRSLSTDLRAIEGIDRVAGLVDLVAFEDNTMRPLLVGGAPEGRDELRARVAAHPFARGRLLSDDGRTTLIVARLDESALAIADIRPTVEAVRALLESIPREGLRSWLTGVPTIRVEIYDTISREQWIFFLSGSAVCLLLSTLLFRSVAAVIVTSAPPLIGSFWSLGFMGLFGQRVDILGSVLPMLVIVIGFTDSVHLMIDVRISRAAGKGPHLSAIEAIRHLGLPCALTSLTTGVGFGSLALGSSDIVGRFGMLAATSVGLVFLAVISVFPLLASWFEDVGYSNPETSGPWSRRFTRAIDWVTGHTKLVVGVGVALTLGLFGSALTLVPENRLTEALPRGEAFEGLMRCEETFGGILPTYVLVEWGEELDIGAPEIVAVVREVEALFERTEETTAPLSFLSLVDLFPEPGPSPAILLAMLPSDLTQRLARPELSKALVQAQVPDGGSEVMIPLYAHLQASLAEIEARHPDVQLHLTGTDFVARSNINGMITDLTRSLALAILIIFGVIALEFRSIFIGLVSLVPNLFPLGVVAGLFVLLDMPLQMTGAVLFTVLLGLAVDDTIHFLARLRRESRVRPDRRDAMRASFLAVGKAILITTAVLGTGFLALVFSAVPTSQMFGAFAFAGLLGALVGDLILLPALLMLRRR